MPSCTVLTSVLPSWKRASRGAFRNPAARSPGGSTRPCGVCVSSTMQRAGARRWWIRPADSVGGRCSSIWLAGIWLTPALAALAFLWLHVPAVAAQTGFPRDEFPVIAAGELTTLPAEIRLLAPDKYGGYLIFRYRGARKVFFDGRSDFYGSGFMKQYIRLMEVRPGWQEQLRAFGFTHALLPNGYSLVPALEQLGWKIVFRDDVATLLENRDREGAGASEPNRDRQGAAPSR